MVKEGKFMVHSFSEINRKLEKSFFEVKRDIERLNENIKILKKGILKVRETNIEKEQKINKNIKTLKSDVTKSNNLLFEDVREIKRMQIFLKGRIKEYPSWNNFVSEEDFENSVRELKNSLKSVKDYDQEIEELKDDFSELSKEFDEVLSETKKSNNLIKSLDSKDIDGKILDIKESMNNFVSKNELKDEMFKLNERIGSVAAKIDVENEIEELRNEVIKLRKELRNTKDSEKSLSKRFDVVDDQVDYMQSHVKKLEKKIRKLKKKEKRTFFAKEEKPLEKNKLFEKKLVEEKKIKGKGFFDKVVDFFDEEA